MIVTAALPWWGELPEDLDRCVRAMANVADRVVALDGAYARYPNATPRSSDDQVAAIRDAAKAVGLECQILQPDRLWAGQVEKRCYLLAMASVGSNWVATVDADHVIHANRDEVRIVLRTLSADALTVPYVTPVNPDRSMDESAVGDWHKIQVAEPQFIPHIWRALPGFRVERFHWWYSAIKGGERIWLWGGDGAYPSGVHQKMRRNYRIEHRTMMRTPEQIRLSRGFLNDRAEIVAKTGQEDDQPKLPRPVFDFDTVPLG